MGNHHSSDRLSQNQIVNDNEILNLRFHSWILTQVVLFLITIFISAVECLLMDIHCQSAASARSSFHLVGGHANLCLRICGLPLTALILLLFNRNAIVGSATLAIVSYSAFQYYQQDLEIEQYSIKLFWQSGIPQKVQ